MTKKHERNISNASEATPTPIATTPTTPVWRARLVETAADGTETVVPLWKLPRPSAGGTVSSAMRRRHVVIGGHPVSYWSLLKSAVFIALFIGGIGLGIALYFVLVRESQRAVEREFSAAFRDVTRGLRKAIDSAVLNAEFIATLFAALHSFGGRRIEAPERRFPAADGSIDDFSAEYVQQRITMSRAEWDAMIRQLEPLAGLPGIAGLMWAAAVSRNDVDVFESLNRRYNFADYTVRDMQPLSQSGDETMRQCPIHDSNCSVFDTESATEDVVFVPANRNRPEYLVIQFVTPTERNRRVIGADVYTLPSYAAFVEARRLGMPSGTASLELFGGRGIGVVLSVPAYSEICVPPTLSRRMAEYHGSGVAILNIGRLVASVVSIPPQPRNVSSEYWWLNHTSNDSPQQSNRRSQLLADESSYDDLWAPLAESPTPNPNPNRPRRRRRWRRRGPPREKAVMDIAVFDLTARRSGAGSPVLYAANISEFAGAQHPNDTQPRFGVWRAELLPFGGDRIWAVVAVPSDAFIGRFAVQRALPVVVLVAVIGAAAALCCYLLYGLRNAIVIKSLLKTKSALLDQILPPAIAKRQMEAAAAVRGPTPMVVAESVPEATIMFADIVGFTELSEMLSASELVVFLGAVFQRLDALLELHSLEKIKTIGDAYMACAGLFDSNFKDPSRESDWASKCGQCNFRDSEEDVEQEVSRTADQVAEEAAAAAAQEAAERRLREQVLRVVRFAVAAMEFTESLAVEVEGSRHRLSMRIGIHTGPVIAGVIGRRKPYFDVWGDAVNVASRMESTGVPAAIQISEHVHKILMGRRMDPSTSTILIDGRCFRIDRRRVNVKGKGRMSAYLIAPITAAVVPNRRSHSTTTQNVVSAEPTPAVPNRSDVPKRRIGLLRLHQPRRLSASEQSTNDTEPESAEVESVVM